VSVCVAAYNEAKTVGRVLREVCEVLEHHGHCRFEIIVCDDGSDDGTAAVIEDARAQIPCLRVISHARNAGIRATVEDLYAAARYEWIADVPGDGEWPPSMLVDLLPLTDRWDVIVASRRDKHYRWFRSLVSWTFNAVPWMLFGVRTYDAGACKLMRRELAQNMAIVSRSPFSEAERLVRAADADARITELPVETSVRQFGQSHGVSTGVLMEAVLDVGRVWWALRGRRVLRRAVPQR
jgi:dolichol-phosphate mannosyltransferase